MSQSLTSISRETQPEASVIGHRKNGLVIGVPKERGFQENRVALSPQSVALLTGRGHEVLIETQAGAASFFSDAMYAEAGAQIAFDKEQLYKAQTIVKVGPIPEDEINFLRPGMTIFSALHLPTLSLSYLEALMKKKVTAVAYEYLRDTENNLPIVRSMGEIAGINSVLIAAEYLSKQFHGNGKLLGGITGVPPSKIVILGAGTVAEFAVRTAMGLGAEVRVFDNSLSKLRRLQNNIGQRVYTSVIHPEVLLNELKSADVAIGAIHSPNGRSPMIVTADMVKQMKSGAVLVDVSIDQGGCFETSRITTHTEPIFSEYDVVHYCVPNIPSLVSKTASIALSNILANFLSNAGDYGGFDHYLWMEKGLRLGVYCYNGAIANKYLSSKFSLPYTNLELHAAARMC